MVVSLATSGWLVSDKGLTSWTEAYVGVGFTVLQLLLLLLGRHAAGKPEAMALASAHVPFRLKLTFVWIGIFFVLALFLSQIGLDWAWIRDNFASSRRGRLHAGSRDRRDRHRRDPRAASERSAGCPRTRWRSASPASTRRSSGARR